MSGKILTKVVTKLFSRPYIMRTLSKENTIMKQPELGRKITELRKAKGMTQEELVEKCNISVRTIQRIEAGEVTPRSYTVKTILAAMEYEFSAVVENGDRAVRSTIGTLKKYLLLERDAAASPGFITGQITIAWIAGVLYFLLGFFDGAAETFRFQEAWMVFSDATYIVIKLSVLIAFIFFQRGFIILGTVYENYLLRIISFFLIFGNIVTTGYDIASIFYDAIERNYVLGAEAFTFGGIGIVYGISLFRLKHPLGNIAKYAGLFELLAGCFFLTILFAFIGFFVMMPAELLEIVLLYKSIGIIKSNYAVQGEEPDVSAVTE
jgi:transcriptional regulator with XRE-family HTH domain